MLRAPSRARVRNELRTRLAFRFADLPMATRAARDRRTEHPAISTREAEFVAACLKEGERSVANKALRKEMGVKGDEFCKCVAKEARTNLSADAQRAMILDMQGKKQEAQAISSKMSDADQMAFMKGGTTVFGKCVGAR